MARERFGKEREALSKRLERMEASFELLSEETMLGDVEALVERARLGGPLREVAEKKVAPEPAQQRDRPTRVHDRLGAARHAVEPKHSPRILTEDHFLADVAAEIAERKFDALVLCAPPKALGLLRRHLRPAIADRVLLAAAKDYAHATLADLATHLQELASGSAH